MKINERGYWENTTDEGHGVDEKLANALVNFFLDEEEKNNYPILFIIDIGCGNGFYTSYLNTYSNQKLMCLGYDGNPNTPEITGDWNCGVADFSQPQRLFDADWVLSLEVGEHIPAEYEDIFIENLDRHNKKGMVISWAIPEHGGDGHFNPRDNDYIINKICKLGYTYDIETTNFLRTKCSPYPLTGWWFTKTLLVFRRTQ